MKGDFIKNNNGFSLVELLIVITIVGLLSTIVLNSLSRSRAKAYDSKVKQQLSSFRTAAELYFANQSPSIYGPAATDCTGGIFNNFDPASGNPGIYIAPGNLPVNTQVVCGSTDTAYAIKATLYDGNDFWCVDSRGVSRATAGAIGGSATFCP